MARFEELLTRGSSDIGTGAKINIAAVSLSPRITPGCAVFVGPKRILIPFFGF
jgi:hypothetical protein